MSDKAEEWRALCDEFEAAMTEWRGIFGPNVAGMAAALGSDFEAQPTIQDLERQERAWEKVMDVDAKMKAFIAANT